MVFKVSTRDSNGELIELTITTNHLAHSLISEKPEIRDAITHEVVKVLYFYAVVHKDK
jgi:hypothetical protein